MEYKFKFTQEAIWFVVVAVLTTLFQALATLDVDKILDWRAWAVGLAAAAVRAAAGAALDWMRTHPSDG